MKEEQLVFQLAKEIGFHYLKLHPRPLASTVTSVRSFEQVLNNFKAGYFAVALLIDEWEFLARIESVFKEETFNSDVMLDWLRIYRVSPDILFQRFNVIAAHWGLDSVFFHRLVNNKSTDRYTLDKELHLHRVDRQYAGRPNEQYCRRWLSSRLIQKLSSTGKQGPITGMMKIRYESSNQTWLCLGLAQAAAFQEGEWTGLMIGVLINDASLQKFRFLDHSNIPMEEVGMTCERCGISNCKDRAAPPILLDQWKKKQAVRDRLKGLTG